MSNNDDNNSNNNNIDTILTKLMDANTNNQLSQQVIDKLYDISNEVEGSKKKVQQDPHDNEILLDEFEWDNITYYAHANGGIWDSNADLVGTIKDYDQDGRPKTCFFFSTTNTESE